VVTPRQGDVYWAETEDKRRPVLVVTRTEAAAVLQRIVVAPVTRTIRSIPTEVLLGPDEGLPVECVASFDNLQPISTSFLTDRLGSLHDRSAICTAVAALTDC
jgi:mRNA interferase MazF